MITPPSFKEALQASQESLPGSLVASAERLGHSWLQRSLESVIFPPAVCPAKRQLSITREEEVVGYWEQRSRGLCHSAVGAGSPSAEEGLAHRPAAPPPPPGAMRFHQSNPRAPPHSSLRELGPCLEGSVGRKGKWFLGWPRSRGLTSQAWSPASGAQLCPWASHRTRWSCGLRVKWG